MRGFSLPAILLLTFLASGTRSADAELIAVRYPQGTAHGFLLMRTLAGKTIAVGELVQVVRGKRVLSRMTFHFHDGSVDDDRCVYTQEKTFRLLTDHHIQQGPSFAKPMDMSIDVPRGTVVMREAQKNGPPKVTTQHIKLPPDLANGLYIVLLENVSPKAAETDLPVVVDYHGARLIHIAVTPQGTVPFRVGGSARAAREFQARAELGGLTGVIAPILGKQPKDWHFLFLEGEAPAFVREDGQLYEDGPVWQIDQVGPVTQESP